MSNHHLTTKGITASLIVGRLYQVHKDDICIEELRLSSGFGWQGRIDFFAISPSPSTGNLATSYEIKVSKSDFNKDTHEKQRGARLYSDRFYYVTPKGMVAPEKIPDWAGLKEVEWKVLHDEEYLSISEKIPAPKLDKTAPSWGLVCSMLRKTHK